MIRSPEGRVNTAIVTAAGVYLAGIAMFHGQHAQASKEQAAPQLAKTRAIGSLASAAAQEVPGKPLFIGRQLAQEASRSRRVEIPKDIEHKYQKPSASQLLILRLCESSNNPTEEYKGHWGWYQFDDSTWADVGGTGHASSAPPAEQTMRAIELVQARNFQPFECRTVAFNHHEYLVVPRNPDYLPPSQR